MKQFYKQKGLIFLVFVLFLCIITVLGLTLPYVNSAMAIRHSSPITCVQSEKSTVALTFEPQSSDEIDRITQALGGTKATFFVTTDFLSENAEQICRLEEDGFEVGLLEKEQKNSKDDLYDILAYDIEFAANILKRNCNLMRFHSNRYNDNSVEAVFNIGLYPIQWSADSYGEHFTRGDIIFAESDADIGSLLERIRADGLEPVSVSELLIEGRYTVKLNGQMTPLK